MQYGITGIKGIIFKGQMNSQKRFAMQGYSKLLSSFKKSLHLPQLGTCLNF